MAGRLAMDVLVRWRGASRVSGMHFYGCRALRASQASATIVRRLSRQARPRSSRPSACRWGSFAGGAEQPRRRRFGRRREG